MVTPYDGEVVEVGLEVFEVEGEVEDVGVGEVVACASADLVTPEMARPARAAVPSESILRRLLTMMSSSSVSLELA